MEVPLDAVVWCTIRWLDETLMVHVNPSMRVDELALRSSRWFGVIPGDRPVLAVDSVILNDDTLVLDLDPTKDCELVLIGGNV